jgi:hypothetical protein
MRSRTRLATPGGLGLVAVGIGYFVLCVGVAAERRRAFAMSDREKLLMALLCESERRSGAKVSVTDVIRMLERLGAEHRHARKRDALLTNA